MGLVLINASLLLLRKNANLAHLRKKAGPSLWHYTPVGLLCVWTWALKATHLLAEMLMEV